jgi:hypothetical protein
VCFDIPCKLQILNCAFHFSIIYINIDWRLSLSIACWKKNLDKEFKYLNTVWTSNVVLAEIVRRPRGGSPVFLTKSLANPCKMFKKMKKKKLKILSGFASDLAKISVDLQGRVSGQFPLGKHCWFIRYLHWMGWELTWKLFGPIIPSLVIPYNICCIGNMHP